ncbi:MAG: cytochrome B [Gammaproteobacteria bacterium]|nr:MAG: cytochrome B [Gammaproteobacteria bacterium]
MMRESTEQIKVWDPLVRIFHWTLLASFSIAYLSSESSGDLHILSGYAVAGLIAFRLVWGLIGSRHARFTDFVRGPGQVKAYLKDIINGRPKRYLGHNPAGGAMIVAMLFMLVLISYTGLKVYGLEGHGPLAVAEGAASAPLLPEIKSAQAQALAADQEDDDDHEGRESEEEEFWEEVHEIVSNLMLGLIALHVLGVIVSSRLHRENLVLAMVTGKKPREHHDD